MIKSREITITVATPNSRVLALIKQALLDEFGGFTMVQGIGAYTFSNGDAVTEQSASFYIGTSKSLDDLIVTVTMIARFYCKVASQESIYYLDIEGSTWLVFANGNRTSL